MGLAPDEGKVQEGEREEASEQGAGGSGSLVSGSRDKISDYGRERSGCSGPGGRDDHREQKSRDLEGLGMVEFYQPSLFGEALDVVSEEEPKPYPRGVELGIPERLPGDLPKGLALALSFTLAWEGYGSDARDPGGVTKWGIAAHANPEVLREDFRFEDAIRIYREKYWDFLKYHPKGLDLPLRVRIALFDTAVNCGILRAVKLLQEAVGTEPDGVIGPHTLARIGMGDPRLVCWFYARERSNYYRRLVEANPKLHPYLRGWTRRSEALGAWLGDGPGTGS